MRHLSLTLPLLLAVSACNSPPEGLAIELTPAAPTTLDAIVANITTEAVDSSAKQEVTYTYTWTRNGDRVTDQSGPEVLAASTVKNDVWGVSVTPTDGKLSGTAVSAEVTVLNTPPTATVELKETAPTTTDDVGTNVNSNDADRDTVTLRYQWSLNGSVTSLTNDTVRANRTNKGEVWEVAVFPHDGDVEGEPATASFTVLNTAPEVISAIVRSDTEPMNAASALSCDGRGWFDEDGDEEGYTVRWFVNGSEVSTAQTLTGEFIRDDRVACELTPNDGEENGTAVLSADALVRNAPPSADEVVIAPEDPTRDDTVRATVTGAEDLDGDEVTYKYSWRVDSREAASTAELPPSRFKHKQSIVLVLTPTDGIDDGPTVTSNEIFGGNNLPSITKLTIQPDPLYTADIVEAEVITEDYDDDPISLTYEWYINSVKQTTTADSLPASDIERLDEVYVIVTPNDGADDGPPVTSATVTVSNSLPTQPELVFDPVEPDVDKDLLCDFTKESTDADEDDITYTFEWVVDSTKVGGATTNYAGDTLKSGDWSDGDAIECTVTPNDGFEDGPSGSVNAVKEWTFTDTTADDIDGKGIMAFMTGLSPKATDYFFFELDSDGDTTNDGAWCSTRADWYVTQYKALAVTGGSATSGTWNKYSRGMGGKWSSATTTGRSQTFGSPCDGNTHSWCSEWGLGGKSLALLPNYTTATGESYAGGVFSASRDWKLTIRVASTRKGACDF